VKIYINNSNENWICDRMRKEIMTHGGPSYFTEDPLEADTIWLLANWTWKQTPINLLTSKKIITTIHHIDPDKLDKQDFLERDQFTDLYHVPSEKTTNFFPEEISKDKIRVVPYWVNEKIWITKNKTECRKKFNVPEDKFIIGSFQRDTEGADLKTPKLSKGPDVFCDIVEQLMPKPHVFLTGWRRQYIISRLEKAGITYSYFEMVDFEGLNDLYNCLDLYLVTSRHEGGPQALLECSSNKTPILSTDVGMAGKVLAKECLMQNSNDFLSCINLRTFDYSDENYQRVQKFKIKNLFSKYLGLFTWL